MFYTAHYKTPQGDIVSLPVATGGEYTTINDFVRDFARNHSGYVLMRIEQK